MQVFVSLFNYLLTIFLIYFLSLTELGHFCRLTNNCIGEDTFCRSGICVCPIDKHSNYYNTACLNNARLLDKCSIDDECIDENSRCHDVCRCSGSHTLSSNESLCLKSWF